jgi:hypothetical protein
LWEQQYIVILESAKAKRKEPSSREELKAINEGAPAFYTAQFSFFVFGKNENLLFLFCKTSTRKRPWGKMPLH